jgi:hypothetical protein
MNSLRKKTGKHHIHNSFKKKKKKRFLKVKKRKPSEKS